MKFRRGGLRVQSWGLVTGVGGGTGTQGWLLEKGLPPGRHPASESEVHRTQLPRAHLPQVCTLLGVIAVDTVLMGYSDWARCG